MVHSNGKQKSGTKRVEFSKAFATLGRKPVKEESDTESEFYYDVFQKFSRLKKTILLSLFR